MDKEINDKRKRMVRAKIVQKKHFRIRSGRIRKINFRAAKKILKIIAEMGPMTIAEIVHRTKIRNRASCYDVLKQLVRVGFLKLRKVDNEYFYQVTPKGMDSLTCSGEIKPVETFVGLDKYSKCKDQIDINILRQLLKNGALEKNTLANTYVKLKDGFDKRIDCLVENGLIVRQIGKHEALQSHSEMFQTRIFSSLQNLFSIWNEVNFADESMQLMLNKYARLFTNDLSSNSILEKSGIINENNKRFDTKCESPIFYNITEAGTFFLLMTDIGDGNRYKLDTKIYGVNRSNNSFK